MVLNSRIARPYRKNICRLEFKSLTSCVLRLSFQCDGGGFPHSNKQFLDTSMVCKNSAQFWHYPYPEIASDSMDWGLSPTRLRPPPFRCHSQAQVVTCSSDQVAIKSEVLKTPSSGSINLLEQFTKLRATFYVLGYQLIMKGWVRNSRWKSCTGQVMGKGRGAFMPSPAATLPAPPCVDQPRSSPNLSLGV